MKVERYFDEKGLMPEIKERTEGGWIPIHSV